MHGGFPLTRRWSERYGSETVDFKACSHPGYDTVTVFISSKLELKMIDDFDLCKHITQATLSRSESWNFIRGFAHRWVTPLEEGDGYSEADLLAAQEQLGISLPIAFKEAYSLFGHRSDLSRNQEYLLEPTALHVDHEALIFRHENQGAACWAILLADLQYDDPPVYIRQDMADKTAEKWELWLGRFSLACLDLILWESLYDKRMATDFRDIDDEDLKLVEQLYTELPSPKGLDGYTPSYIRWFTGPNLLLCDMGSHLAIRAHSWEAVGSVRQNLPGDWLNK